MAAFLQAVGGVLVAVILCAVLNRQGKDFTVLLSTAVCIMVLIAASAYLEPVMMLIETLIDTAQLDSDLFQTILKAVGIGLIGELASLICADSGNAALGKTVEILTAGVILWLSIPLMTALLELVQQMVGSV